MIKKKIETSGISLVLFSVFLISLFLATMSTVMAADTSASKIIIDGEEILLPGSSEKILLIYKFYKTKRFRFKFKVCTHKKIGNITTIALWKDKYDLSDM